MVQFLPLKRLDTVVDRNDCTPALLWSKTTQTTDGVGRTWEDPHTCKMGTFFLMSLTLSEPSFLKTFLKTISLHLIGNCSNPAQLVSRT